MTSHDSTLKMPEILRSILRGPVLLAKLLAGRARMPFSVRPLSPNWGFDRGLPVHRYYVKEFLREFSGDIRGRCLEFNDGGYTAHFGGNRVEKADILHLDHSNPKATIVADLTKPNDIPPASFDCVICTHVLHIIAEPEKMIAELYRILKPGGTVLFAVPCVSMCAPDEHELWRFTPEGLGHVLAGAFGKDAITVKSYGNSLTAAGEIRGMASSEFTKAELDSRDERFPVEVCARAFKGV